MINSAYFLQALSAICNVGEIRQESTVGTRAFFEWFDLH